MSSKAVGSPGYFPPGLSEYGGLRHMILVYSRRPNDWPAEDFRYSVTHLNSQDNPDDWFFDSFLFMPAAPPSRNSFYPGVNLGTTRSGQGDFFIVPTSNPARKEDWEWLLNNYFGEKILEDAFIIDLKEYDAVEAYRKSGPLNDLGIESSIRVLINPSTNKHPYNACDNRYHAQQNGIVLRRQSFHMG